MARLRATAPAERSILYGREHDGMLTRIGGRSRAHQPNLKKRANRQLKKRDHADMSASRRHSKSNQTWRASGVSTGWLRSHVNAGSLTLR